MLDLTPLSDMMLVSAPGARLAVEHAGTGPAVVCLHAGVADRRSWRPMAPFLVDDHHVIAWDRRGFGDTVVEEVGWFDHVADLLAIMDAMELESAVLVGNSQGGRVAMDAALEHPDRVAGVVMLAAAWTGAPYPPDPPHLAAIEEELAAAEASGELARVNEVEARIWLDGTEASPGRVDGTARELFLDMNGRALRADAVGEEVERAPAWPQLPSLAAPVTVVACSLDEPSSLVVGRLAAEAMPAGRFELLEGVAHLPTLEDPKAVASIVRDLVERTT